MLAEQLHSTEWAAILEPEGLVGTWVTQCHVGEMTRSVNETRRLIFLTFSVLAHEMKFALRRKTGTAAATINAHTHGATFNVERDRFELRNGAARYCRCSG